MPDNDFVVTLYAFAGAVAANAGQHRGEAAVHPDGCQWPGGEDPRASQGALIVLASSLSCMTLTK